MKKFAVSALLLASAVSMSACSTLKGAGIGAAGGAGVAAATGGSVEKGAAVGGAGGAVVGTVADCPDPDPGQRIERARGLSFPAK